MKIEAKDKIEYKMVFGRKIPIISKEVLTKEVKTYGKGGCHISVPRSWLGRKCTITSNKLKPFVCSKCYDIFSGEYHFSPKEEVCRFCYAEEMAVKNNKCLACKGADPKAEQWGLCDKCFKSHDFEYDYTLEEDKTTKIKGCEVYKD